MGRLTFTIEGSTGGAGAGTGTVTPDTSDSGRVRPVIEKPGPPMAGLISE